MDLIKEMRDQVASLQIERHKTPDRIRVTELTPPGTMFLSPFEWDESIPLEHRRAGDNRGPSEVVVNPEDWEDIVRPHREAIERFGQDDRPCLVSEPAPNLRSVSGWVLWGIPVKDDTIKARMEGDA